MGGTTNTSTTSTKPSNPDVNPTVSKLLKGLQGAYDSGVQVFDQSLYPGLSSTTQGGLSSLLAGADPAGYSNSVSGAISDFGDIAAGNRFGTNEPGYAALRAKLADDTLTGVNSIFAGSGRFGSGSHVDTATNSLVSALGGLDYANFQNDQQRQMAAAGLLPGLYEASQLPAQTQLQAGQIMDADALAQRQAQNDLFRRQNDSVWDALARSSSILAGTAPSGGSTTTNTQPGTPLWQTLMGGAIGLGGLLL